MFEVKTKYKIHILNKSHQDKYSKSYKRGKNFHCYVTTLHNRIISLVYISSYKTFTKGEYNKTVQLVKNIQ